MPLQLYTTLGRGTTPIHRPYTLNEVCKVLHSLYELTITNHKLSRYAQLTLDGVYDLSVCHLDESKCVAFEVLKGCQEAHGLFPHVDFSSSLTEVITECCLPIPDILTTLGKVTCQPSPSPSATFESRRMSRLASVSPNRLLALLNKVLAPHKLSLNDIDALKSLNDVEAMQRLREAFPPHVQSEGDAVRLSHRVKDVCELMKKEMKSIPTNALFVDYGGSNGDFAHAFAAELKAKHSVEVIPTCMDLSQWLSKQYPTPHADVKYVNIHTDDFHLTQPSPFVLSVLQVLHHVDTPHRSLKRLTEWLQPGGYLILREHDCRTIEDELAIDLEHLLYEVYFRQSLTALQTYQATYVSRRWLYASLKELGMTWVCDSSVKGVTNCYYTLWRKPSVLQIYGDLEEVRGWNLKKSALPRVESLKGTEFEKF